MLYFQDGKPKKIADEMMQVFLAFITNRCAISNTLPQEELIAIIAQKSDVNLIVIKVIYDQNFKLKYNPMTKSEDLILLHKNIQYFYKNCK